MRGLRRWQFRVTGWAAAYALALHAILMLIGPLPAKPGSGFDAAAILCLAGDHGGASQAGEPQQGDGGQADHRHAADHCVLCASNAAAPPIQTVLAAPARIASRQAAAAIVSMSFDRRTAGRPSLPRAPPPTA